MASSAENVQKPSLIYIKEKSTKIKFEIQICLIFFSLQKCVKLFLSVQGTNTFSEFLFVAFKQAKKQILFQVQPLKNLNKKIAHFRVTVKTFRDPAPC